MAQPKPHFKNLQNDRERVSTVDSCGHSAKDSASLTTAGTDQKILTDVGLTTPTTAFHAGPSGIILHLFPQLAPSTVPQHIRDIETLKPAKLKQAYPKEHNSRRSRMDYARKTGTSFHPPWKSFPAFLRDLGPIPSKGYTLDKLDPVKGYIPGNVRWASKKEQTHNRPNTNWLIYNGERKPLGVWAKENGLAESTLRERQKRGWPDENIITGIRPEKFTLPPSGRPWPPGHAKAWEQAYQKGTGGNADPIRYMGYVISKNLIRLSQETEYRNYPPYYSPTPEESKALERHTKEFEYWHKQWRHLQQVRTSKRLPPYPSPDESYLRNWHS